jgi:hypothetical protein
LAQCGQEEVCRVKRDGEARSVGCVLGVAMRGWCGGAAVRPRRVVQRSKQADCRRERGYIDTGIVRDAIGKRD